MVGYDLFSTETPQYDLPASPGTLTWTTPMKYALLLIAMNFTGQVGILDLKMFGFLILSLSLHKQPIRLYVKWLDEL